MLNTKILLLSLVLVLVITLSVFFILKDNIKFELFENNVIPNELINEREQLKDTNYITMADISSGINTNKVDTQNLNVLDTIKSKNINTNKLTSTDYIVSNNNICLDKNKFQELSNFDKNAISGNSMNITKSLNIKGGKSVHNPKGWWSHFPWIGDGKNYIRGDTEIRGNVNNIGDLTVGGFINSNKSLNVKGGKSVHNPNGWGTHFPWSDGKNYIRGDTEIRGDITKIGDTYGNHCIIYGPGNRYKFCFQGDGHPVQYKDGEAVWATGKFG